MDQNEWLADRFEEHRAHLRAVGYRMLGSLVIRGAAAVAGQALMFSRRDAQLHPMLVSGVPGVVVTVAGRPFAVMGFTVADGRIIEIDAIADPDRVRRIAAAVLIPE